MRAQAHQLVLYSLGGSNINLGVCRKRHVALEAKIPAFAGIFLIQFSKCPLVKLLFDIPL
jgi:hypothetical protein